MKTRPSWAPLAWLAVLVGVWSCALSVAPTGSSDRELTMELAVYPDRVSIEDSTATAEVWATVRRGDRAIEDSTLVVFATTVGRITASSLTRDGLAVAILSTPGDGRPRRGEVVAQALTVRDTLEVDFVLFGDQ